MIGGILAIIILMYIFHEGYEWLDLVSTEQGYFLN